METLTLYRNKPEVFKCELEVEGATINNTTVKLCLEFEDNKNFYFYGKLDEKGICNIPIPKLTEVNKTDCKMIIEVVADSTYFKVYEADVKLKNSVEVKIKTPNVNKTVEVNEVGIKMGKILRETPKVVEEEPEESVYIEPKKASVKEGKESSIFANHEKPNHFNKIEIKEEKEVEEGTNSFQELLEKIKGPSFLDKKYDKVSVSKPIAPVSSFNDWYSKRLKK